jgi:hypothetical protein
LKRSWYSVWEKEEEEEKKKEEKKKRRKGEKEGKKKKKKKRKGEEKTARIRENIWLEFNNHNQIDRETRTKTNDEKKHTKNIPSSENMRASTLEKATRATRRIAISFIMENEKSSN